MLCTERGGFLAREAEAGAACKLRIDSGLNGEATPVIVTHSGRPLAYKARTLGDWSLSGAYGVVRWRQLAAHGPRGTETVLSVAKSTTRAYRIRTRLHPRFRIQRAFTRPRFWRGKEWQQGRRSASYFLFYLWEGTEGRREAPPSSALTTADVQRRRRLYTPHARQFFLFNFQRHCGGLPGSRVSKRAPLSEWY